MLVLPIHGQPDDVLSDFISNLRGCMRRMLARRAIIGRGCHPRRWI